MSIKEKIDKLTAEYEQARAESDRMWEIFQAGGEAWLAAHNKTAKLGHHLNALKELAGEDHTAEQIEQDWSE